jgi:hypothetical protein
VFGSGAKGKAFGEVVNLGLGEGDGGLVVQPAVLGVGGGSGGGGGGGGGTRGYEAGKFFLLAVLCD